MDFSYHIANILFHRNRVTIPNYGTFILKRNSAQFINRDLKPPKQQIQFNSSIKNDDEFLTSTIVLQEKVTFVVAKEKINEYVHSINESLKNNREFKITQVGKLYMDNNDNLRFKPEDNQKTNQDSFGLPKLTLNEIDRSKTQNDAEEGAVIVAQRSKSKVGVPFIILSVLFILALSYLLYKSYDSFSQLNDQELEKAERATQQKEAELPSNNKKLVAITDSTILNDDDMNHVGAQATLPDSLMNTNIETPIRDVQQENNHANEEPFHVVLGLYAKESSALQIKQKAIKAGYKNTKVIQGSKYNRVVIPFYKSEISWKDAQKDVRENFQKDAWVWETRK